MFGSRMRLVRLAGIPIYVDFSWLIIVALITWTLSDMFRAEVTGLPPSRALLLGLLAALGFFLCILLHELGHALVARAEGIPMRGITLFLFGGVAEMTAEPPSAGKEFLMAIAGPAVTVVLAGIFFILWIVAEVAEGPPEAILFVEYLFQINVAVLLFNMVPAFPLDGGRVLRSALWAATGSLRRSTRWASLGGQGFAWLLIIGGVALLFNQALFQGIWLIIIGLFLNNAARGSYQQLVIRQALQGEPVARFMNRDPIVVPPSLTLRNWVEDYVYRYHRKMFPVASDGRLEGVISTQMLQGYPREEWDRHSVGEVMTHDLEPVSIPPETDALQALAQMQRTGSSRLLVTEGDRLLGILSLKDLLRFLQLKMELEPEEKGQ
jgi:Zn-dependent protease